MLGLAGSVGAPEASADAPPAPADCVGCGADVQGVREGLSKDDWAKLVAGEVITSELKEGSGGEARRLSRAYGVISHPSAHVWSTLTDFTSWPTFFPNVKQTLVRRAEGNRVWISQHLKVAFVNVRYGAIWTLDPLNGLGSFRLDEQVPHDIAAIEGFWQVLPIDGGTRTLVTYSSKIETGKLVPAFIESALLKRSLPNAVLGLRDEVDRRPRSEVVPAN